MRFPEVRLLVAAVLAATSVASHGAAEQVRTEVASQLQRALPGVPAADYALGGAAIDPAMRAAAEQNAAQAANAIEAGRKLWTRKFRNGRALSGCFPNGGRRVASTYPQYDARMKRVITLEMAINQCLRSHHETAMEPTDAATMGAVTAYLRSLANGQKMAVRVPAAAEDRFEQGRRLYFTRMGQRNFSCASCHVNGAGKRYGEVVLSPAMGQAAAWPVIREGSAMTLQMSIRECLERMGAAPFPGGSDELNHIEYFLSFLSNGIPVKANGWKPRQP